MAKWTADEDALLKRLSDEGADVKRMMAELDKPKNAIIGRCHRRGYRVNHAQRTKAAKRTPKAPRQAKQPSPNLAPPVAPDVTLRRIAAIDAEANTKLVATVDLLPHHCKFPHSEPGKPGFGHCGSPKQPGTPYCERHAAICFLNDDDKAERRRWRREQEEKSRGIQRVRINEIV